ncbi:MAG: cysteine desulfurase family protein [Planctomycetaceae bacterium]
MTDDPAVIYLDHAAATPPQPRSVEALRDATVLFGNPSSPHSAGRRARAALEDARERIIALLGGRTSAPGRDRFVFTSGATEANRLGILGTAGRRPGTVAISPRDHGSVVTAAEELAAGGWSMTRLPPAADGTWAATDEISARQGRVLVTATLVCSQTGIREDFRRLPRPTADGRVLVHADATQAVAWDRIAFRDLPVTSLALAAHKVGGPRGIGGLLVRGDVDVTPVMAGPQELGLRGGTESVPLAVAFAVALEAAIDEQRAVAARVASLRGRLEHGIAAAAGRHGFEALIVGQEADRAPHIATIAVRGCDRQAVVMACDLAGVCLATGTACASGSSEPAPAIQALPLPSWVPQAAFRASLASTTTDREIDEAVRRINGVFRGFATAGLLGGDSAR